MMVVWSRPHRNQVLDQRSLNIFWCKWAGMHFCSSEIVMFCHKYLVRPCGAGWREKGQYRSARRRPCAGKRSPSVACWGDGEQCRHVAVRRQHQHVVYLLDWLMLSQIVSLMLSDGQHHSADDARFSSCCCYCCCTESRPDIFDHCMLMEWCLEYWGSRVSLGSGSWVPISLCTAV